MTLHRAGRTGAPVGVMMIDIDYFKNFNDENGHDAGDAILRALGALLRGELRGSDTACRYGGEEFAIFLPDASLEVARQRAQHLCERVRSLRVSTGTKQLGAITISVGVAAFPGNGSDRDALFVAADRALYRAKREGRNRVVGAGDPALEPAE